MERDDLVVLMKLGSVSEAGVKKALLESAGIQAYILDQSMGSIYGMPIRLAVASHDEKKAREVLAADFDHESFKEESKKGK